MREHRRFFLCKVKIDENLIFYYVLREDLIEPVKKLYELEVIREISEEEWNKIVEFERTLIEL